MKEAQLKTLATKGIYRGKALHGSVEETHISWVILAGRFAFKIKKPLKFSFLDFSSLAKRKKYCEREVELNRRFSDIYLGVVPIRYNGNMWRLGGVEGRVVDFAVQMRRMQYSKRMDFMLQSGKVAMPQIISLAKSVASFHARAEIITSSFSLAFARKAFNDIRVAKHVVAATLPEKYLAIVTRSAAWSDAFLLRHKRRLQQRVDAGFKRDLHGDLHSGNIFLYRRPVIFDCIEFNDAYRQTDVLDEVAFFCMDLEANDQHAFSHQFTLEYSRHFPCFLDDEDRRIFTYFKCYRANVRAKVHALAAKQEADPTLYARHLEWIRKYLLLMASYMTTVENKHRTTTKKI